MKSINLYQLILITLIFVACESKNQSNKNSCSPPDFQISKEDLIGTWETGLPSRKDILIIKYNTYKQIIHVESESYNYESDWLPWTYEISKDGIPYVHLEGMRLCVYWQGADCENIGGGNDEWFDFCKKEWVKMPNKGILIVLGTPKELNLPAQQISLFALQRSTEDVTGYNLQLTK